MTNPTEKAKEPHVRADIRAGRLVVHGPKRTWSTFWSANCSARSMAPTSVAPSPHARNTWSDTSRQCGSQAPQPVTVTPLKASSVVSWLRLVLTKMPRLKGGVFLRLLRMTAKLTLPTMMLRDRAPKQGPMIPSSMGLRPKYRQT